MLMDGWIGAGGGAPAWRRLAHSESLKWRLQRRRRNRRRVFSFAVACEGREVTPSTFFPVQALKVCAASSRRLSTYLSSAALQLAASEASRSLAKWDTCGGEAERRGELLSQAAQCCPSCPVEVNRISKLDVTFSCA